MRGRIERVSEVSGWIERVRREGMLLQRQKPRSLTALAGYLRLCKMGGWIEQL